MTSAGRPDVALAWISRPKVQDLLERIGRDERLAAQGLALDTCTQADLERWMTDPAFTYSDETGHFVRWSAQHRHAHGLTLGTVRWTGPQGSIDSEIRWADARRLLNDDTLPTADRVAGLLLILYAQQISTISELTVDDVNITGETAAITFGTSPVVLPLPLATLVRKLLVNRRGKAKIGTPDDGPWLLPGGQPGRPLGDSQIGAAPQDRHSPPAGPLHCPVHPRHRTPRRRQWPDEFDVTLMEGQSRTVSSGHCSRHRAAFVS
ncbi:hypothetical protein [Streptomyces sasae]|uniref:hypothetical protein n=1 Tax=Streptomyces sasae TaxID=1266772 RepID=UPI0029316824|nr:hypothetical protein [Streptomyces sasae]